MQMLWLQICPLLQSELTIQPTLMGADELTGGGEATQMLWLQTCPLAQSLLVMQPSMTGVEEGSGLLLEGAAMQMLRWQTCPEEQSALESQPSKTVVEEGMEEEEASADDVTVELALEDGADEVRV
jgi:hypothetical protein